MDVAASGIEVDTINEALQERVCLSDRSHVCGDALANFIRKLADKRPNGLFHIVRNEGEIKANKLMVRLDELKGLLARADFFRNTVYLVIKDIAKAFSENERKNVVLVFRRILGSANRAGCIPYSGFERLVFRLFGWHI